MHSSGGRFAIRQGDWKLIEAKGSGGWTRVEVADDAPDGQLYNLAADPAETQNLYEAESERVSEMRTMLEEVRRD